MSPKRAGVKNSDAAKASRVKLLQAGAEMMVEQAERNPFASLRVREICERAGYSTGAFHMHWPKVDEYHDALGGYLVAASGEMFDEAFAEMMAVVDTNATSAMPEAAVAVADQDFASLLSDRMWDAMELLSVTWARTPRMQATAAAGYIETDHSTAEVYGRLLSDHGREPCPPLSILDIAVILQGLVEGIGLRAKVDTSIDPSYPNPRLFAGMTAYSAAVTSVLAVLTRPVGSNQDLGGQLDMLFEHRPPTASSPAARRPRSTRARTTAS